MTKFERSTKKLIEDLLNHLTKLHDDWKSDEVQKQLDQMNKTIKTIQEHDYMGD